MKWFKLDADLPEQDFINVFKVNGKKICLIRNQGKLHAVQNRCPHAGGILSKGWCKNGNVVCPIHRYEYDLETGRGAAAQRDYIDIYPVEERSDGIYIGMKESFWKRLFS
ncbi:Rieske (2Fe-2S) protein [Nubsella zeaxanthinifaciens]|uniref:Rieske (2Fe-2S) protein n=1 Tax=Nubsella zeaxanthinifaciens TaxID=392412 RepID=UPI000DE26015|nr:Rieske (2Fe-2S) protein [Nubsella zeaxanthinifaciens]